MIYGSRFQGHRAGDLHKIANDQKLFEKWDKDAVCSAQRYQTQVGKSMGEMMPTTWLARWTLAKMVTNVLFDVLIPCLAQAVTASLGDEVMQNGVILRDASGRLSFVVNRAAYSKGERTKAAKALREALGPYARRDRVLAFNDDPGASPLLEDLRLCPFMSEALYAV